MEEKVRDSVMERVGWLTLVGLVMVCCTTEVFAERRQELDGYCLHVKECYRIGYLCASNRTCQCGFGYVANEKRSKCIGIIGSKCIYDSQCIEGAYCTGREGREVCRCREQDNYYPSEDYMSCIDSASSVPFTYAPLIMSLFWAAYYLQT